MTIHVDKCCTFGIKKFSSKSVQIQPKLFINKESVPCVKLDDSFRYLGRHFDFQMSNPEFPKLFSTQIPFWFRKLSREPQIPINMNVHNINIITCLYK